MRKQLLGSQESTCSKRTLSLSHKQRMLALRHQVRSRSYAVRQNVLLVYMVFALTQIYWLKSNVCWGYVGANTHSHLAVHRTIPNTFISPWSNEYPELPSSTMLNLCNINTLSSFVLSCNHIWVHNTMSKEMWWAQLSHKIDMFWEYSFTRWGFRTVLKSSPVSTSTVP